MDAASHQKIVGYFIEEAREHLETLEKGILELASAIQDTERINELFRAAHSLKGGAAMLGFSSIQKTAHRLEDAFKILRENDIEVDQTLESLFLDAFDILQKLIEKLDSPSGLQDDEAEKIIQEALPNFAQLQNYLNKLVGDHPSDDDSGPLEIPIFAPVTNKAGVCVSTSNLNMEAKKILKQMLEIFKKQETPETRQRLQELCGNLGKMSPGEQGWQKLVKTCHSALGNPKYSYHLLAPVIIKELKRGCDYIELNKPEEISPSQTLQQLAAARLPQILIPLEPKAAANNLLKVFSKQQLSELINLLKAARNI